MEPSEPPAGKRSPRRELQGPRPTPLKVNKDSHKLKKPQHAQPHHRPPVIIYTTSPKVIHAEPGEFMTIVQRLTGASSSSVGPSTASRPSPSYSNENTSGVAMLPDARMAAVEKTVQRSEAERHRKGTADVIEQLGFGSGDTSVDRAQLFPGISSPVPSSVPSIHPTFFWPSVDQNSPNILHDFSLMYTDSNTPMEGSSLAGPSNFVSTTSCDPSPSANWDPFNQFQDF